MKNKRIVNRQLLNTYNNQPCLICGSEETTVGHHLKTKGSGGHDIEINIIPVCYLHHIEQLHKMGLTKFANIHPIVIKFLISNGWQFNDFTEKWFNAECST